MLLFIVAPRFYRDGLEVFMGNGLDEEAGLLDLGEEGNVMIDSIATHNIIIVNVLHHMPIYDINGKIDFILLKLGQEIWLFLLVKLIQFSSLDAMLLQVVSRLLSGIERNTQLSEQFGALKELGFFAISSQADKNALLGNSITSGDSSLEIGFFKILAEAG